VLHDLRRTFATRPPELGVVLPRVRERLLNHRLGSITNKTRYIATQFGDVYNLATLIPEMWQAA
jgi:hypothetical protein